MLSSSAIKLINSLKKKKFRSQHQKFIVEGAKSVGEVVKEIPTYIDTIYVTEDEYIRKYTGFNCVLISEREMKSISDLKTPTQILAIVNYFEVKSPSSSPLTLALDSIQDPGNFGTIIRIADWFGVSKIICSKETVDCYNSKVVQATMGSLFRCSIEYTNLEEYLERHEGEIIGAFMDGEPMKNVEIKNDSILVMGNEGNGISDKISKLITKKITIPGSGNAESLNVGVATGILVSHLV